VREQGSDENLVVWVGEHGQDGLRWLLDGCGTTSREKQ
jgi:hypothetical protein